MSHSQRAFEERHSLRSHRGVITILYRSRALLDVKSEDFMRIQVSYAFWGSPYKKSSMTTKSPLRFFEKPLSETVPKVIRTFEITEIVLPFLFLTIIPAKLSPFGCVGTVTLAIRQPRLSKKRIFVTAGWTTSVKTTPKPETTARRFVPGMRNTVAILLLRNGAKRRSKLKRTKRWAWALAIMESKRSSFGWIEFDTRNSLPFALNIAPLVKSPTLKKLNGMSNGRTSLPASQLICNTRWNGTAYWMSVFVSPWSAFVKFACLKFLPDEILSQSVRDDFRYFLHQAHSGSASQCLSDHVHLSKCLSEPRRDTSDNVLKPGQQPRLIRAEEARPTSISWW